MTNITSGLDALNLLQDDQQGAQNEFTSLKSGDTKTVKILDFGDFIGVPTYSIFKVVNTFTPEKLAKLSANGYPVEDLTPFDKAWKYHKDQSEEFGDHHSTEASKYRLKPRFAIGFYDLDAEEEIVIDFSKNQAKAILAVVQKQHEAGRLGKRAFELEKSGSGTSTVVSITPTPLDDLTDSQQKAFEGAPKEFDKSKFEGLYFVMNEEQQIQSLTQAGFDVSLIGLAPKAQDEVTAEANPFENAVDPTQGF